LIRERRSARRHRVVEEENMLDLSVSWLQLVVVAAVNFFVSWLYYSPAVPWFKAWARGIGMDPGKREMTEEEKKGMPGLMLGAALASLLLSYGLQVFVRGTGASTFGSGALVGAAAWLAFVVTQGLNTRFEGRKDSVIVIGYGLYLPTYAVFAGLLAVWK
jgi:hypothetical protein